MFAWFRLGDQHDESSGDEVQDDRAQALSHVGMAAYDVLRKHHNHHHHELWNVTQARIEGPLHLTPRESFVQPEFPSADGHDEWFPEKCGEILARTKVWADVLSLAPPDGLFLDSFKQALVTIVENHDGESPPVVVRMMFGNIIGMPCNCNSVLAELTADFPEDADSKLKLWVGSWRKGCSWNHAKIIAVDAQYCWTGGHNFWDAHYLRSNPVCDLSLELAGGSVARDAHRYADSQWRYICKKQSNWRGQFVDQYVSDAMDTLSKARVTVSEFPESADEFPPYYRSKVQAGEISFEINEEDGEGLVPVITMGRYGALLKKSRPSDDAIVAMIDSAQTVIRFALQDIGPACLPNTKLALPGCVWPDDYLSAMARVLWERGVDLEFVLSNPNSIPGGLTPMEANYGNGWTCNDVASEIIKRIQRQFPDAEDDDLRQKVQDNLRLCYLRCSGPDGEGTNEYEDGGTFGHHSKHFIVDDQCCYIGSQNLYICDLAEWGVVIDDQAQVQAIKEELWDPMWTVCYAEERDCNVDEVMDGLEIDRDAPEELDEEQKAELSHMARNCPFAAQGLDDDDSEAED